MGGRTGGGGEGGAVFSVPEISEESLHFRNSQIQLLQHGQPHALALPYLAPPCFISPSPLVPEGSRQQRENQDFVTPAI